VKHVPVLLMQKTEGRRTATPVRKSMGHPERPPPARTTTPPLPLASLELRKKLTVSRSVLSGGAMGWGESV
jgi:hypothetical protein